MRTPMLRYIVALAASCLVATGVVGQDGSRPEPTPHGQTRPPGLPLSPEQAVARMTVPEGFSVEVVAAEPDIVNPVAMTFDERGRIWITESLEYPRNEPGPGQDRVKVLEDTDGDGRADKFTVFADGLNIPSGIAVGHGGVWVANAPDILFLQDTDGDGKADTREVVVTGFGRDDTHELPNSLTWGPDGWLYGWNGVFNRSVVKQSGKTFDFTCALFRIHPRTREFQLFAEGTSNPWGVTFNAEGSAFASACVIDHLWHLVETGYYHRQGGPYPPYTWKLESIVDHNHQKAAYCGIHYFDSDAYPPEYRQRLYMGNIHGNAINMDLLEKNGSTYRGRSGGDFLSANDAWFMPVVQKTGPDGCLYILDWYDRYHCYQDARRDPAGIDRLKGRLYRIRYRETPRAPRIDLASETDDELIGRLLSPNLFYRDIAQRLLAERARPETLEKLERMVLDDRIELKSRLHALWSLVSARPLEVGFHGKLLQHAEPLLRAWAVRAAGNMGKVHPEIAETLARLVRDPSPEVALQAAVACRKVGVTDTTALLLEAVSAHSDDRVIPAVVWQNLHPLIEANPERVYELLTDGDSRRAKALAVLGPRVVDRLMGTGSAGLPVAVRLFRFMLDRPEGLDRPELRGALDRFSDRVESGQLAGEELVLLGKELEPSITGLQTEHPANPITRELTLLSASWGGPRGVATAVDRVLDAEEKESIRLRAFQILIGSDEGQALGLAERVLSSGTPSSASFRGQVLSALSRTESNRVAELLLGLYAGLEPELRPRIIELLTQRAAWAQALVAAVRSEKIAKEAVNVNQIRRLIALKDPELSKLVRSIWGSVRETRNPQRELVINQMRGFLREHKGDPAAGREAFRKVCAQCHQMYGEGQEVGPDLTLNGRGSFEQLLSNVFDPSLVIGEAYQATTVATTDGRVISGLLVEDTAERVVLKTQGGKLETVARADVEEIKQSELSLMPEGVEGQLTPPELIDLFTFLSLDRPPGDPKARPIPGSP